MSILHMAAIWEDPYYSHSDKTKLLVALAIADNARGEDGRAWPSIEYIAKKARSSVRGAQEAIRELERDGKMEVHPFKGVNGTNLYIVLLPPATVAPPRNEAPVKAAAGCTQIIRNRQEPSLKNKKRGEQNRSESTSIETTPTPSPQKALPPLPYELRSIADVWGKFVNHCEERRKPLTPTSASVMFDMMMDRGEADARRMIVTAITTGNTGIVPPRSKTSPPPKQGPAQCRL